MTAKIEKFLFYFLCGFAFFLPLSNAAANIFLTLSLIAFFARIYRKRDDCTKIFLEYKNIFAVIFILLAAVLISALTSENLLRGVGKFLERYILHMSIILPTLFIIRDKKKILRLAGILICGAFISNLSVFIKAAQNLSEPVWRFGGVLSPMIQGSLLAMILPIYVLLALHVEDRRLKIFFAGASVVGTFALLLTGTRGVWLAALILIPVSVFIYSKNKLKNLGIILISLSIVGGIFLSTPTLSNRMATLSDPQMQSNRERLLIWQSAWSMFKDNPIFGVGYAGYTEAYQTEYISPLARERDLGHAHSNFFQMLAECGMVGFGAFVLMLIYFSYFCLRGWTKEKNIAYLMFFCVLWGMILHGATEFNFETSMTSKFYWFSLALCLAYVRKGKYL